MAGNGANGGVVANNDTVNLITADTSVMSFIIPASQVLANDKVQGAGHSLSIISAQGISGATVEITPKGDLQVFPTNPYDPSDNFSYTISDGHGNTSTADVTVNYTVANSPPVVTNGSETVPAVGNTNIDIPFSALLADASDPDGDTLSILGVSGIRGVGGITNPVLNFFPTKEIVDVQATNGSFAAGDSVTFNYVVGDSAGLSAIGQYTVTVS